MLSDLAVGTWNRPHPEIIPHTCPKKNVGGIPCEVSISDTTYRPDSDGIGIGALERYNFPTSINRPFVYKTMDLVSVGAGGFFRRNPFGRTPDLGAKGATLYPGNAISASDRYRVIPLDLIRFSSAIASPRVTTSLVHTTSQGTPARVDFPSPLLCSANRLPRCCV